MTVSSQSEVCCESEDDDQADPGTTPCEEEAGNEDEVVAPPAERRYVDAQEAHEILTSMVRNAGLTVGIEINIDEFNLYLAALSAAMSFEEYAEARPWIITELDIIRIGKLDFRSGASASPSTRTS